MSGEQQHFGLEKGVDNFSLIEFRFFGLEKYGHFRPNQNKLTEEACSLSFLCFIVFQHYATDLKPVAKDGK